MKEIEKQKGNKWREKEITQIKKEKKKMGVKEEERERQEDGKTLFTK